MYVGVPDNSLLAFFMPRRYCDAFRLERKVARLSSSQRARSTVDVLVLAAGVATSLMATNSRGLSFPVVTES